MSRYLPHYAFSLRLKPSIGQLLDDLAKKMGMSKTSVLIVAIRDLARKEGVSEREETADHA